MTFEEMLNSIEIDTIPDTDFEDNDNEESFDDFDDDLKDFFSDILEED